MKKAISFLSQPIDNVQLVAFRVLFGVLIMLECTHNIRSGTVKILYLDITHNFAFFGFEWLGFLHGHNMLIYFACMALCGFFIMAGLAYRLFSLLFAFMWTVAYLSHKDLYNNHYYLMVLLAWLMALMPANKRFSLDAKLGWAQPANMCYRWQVWIFIFQVSCVYFFAGISKINADWLQAIPLKVWLPKKAGIPFIGHFLAQPYCAWLVSYVGLLFDLLVVPGMLYKPTRIYFFALGVVFHLFNAWVFAIGFFPFLALSMSVFFFPPPTFQRVIPLQKNGRAIRDWRSKKGANIFNLVVSAYVLLQLVLPVRHYFIPGPVNWTSEGYRMAWRMMLYARSGECLFKVVNTKNDSTWYVNPSSFLHNYQVVTVAVLPDVTLQAAHYLRDKYATQQLSVSVYAINKVSINFSQPRLLIDTTTDLAHTQWRFFGHNKWILYP